MRAAAAFLLAAASGAATPISTPLVGAWSLVTYRDTPAGEVSVEAFGSHPIGQFVFAADGHASVSIMRNPPAPGTVSTDLDPDACVPDWYCSYFGTYRVAPDGQAWTIHVEGANIPSFLHTDQTRPFRIDGERLVLSTTYEADGRTVRAERVLIRQR